MLNTMDRLGKRGPAENWCLEIQGILIKVWDIQSSKDIYMYTVIHY